MKKILVVTPYFYPHIGGSEYYMENIYAFLRKNHPEIGVDLLCYDTDSSGLKDTYRGLNIKRVPCWEILKDQFAIPKPLPLIKFLTREGQTYDLIHCSTRFFDSSWWAPFWAKLIGKKIILTDHCAESPVHKNRVITLLAKLIDLTIVKASLYFYDEVFVTNIAAKKFLKRTFGQNSKIIYGGVDTDIFKPAKRGLNNKLQIAFVGRMIESKGVQDLYKVACSIVEVNFVFIGEGSLVQVLRQDIARKKVRNVKIYGPLSRLDINKLLRDSDILAHPSRHNEGFPNVLVEAGATGIATIATDVGGTNEIIINKKTGLLIPPNDQIALKGALLALMRNKKLRERLGRNLYNFVTANFTWEKASEKLYKELKKCLLNNS